MSERRGGLAETGVLDAMAFDAANDEIVLAIFALDSWDDTDLRLHQLQEKLNAYCSFALDGEMHDAFPHLAGKPLRIQLRSASEPPGRVLEFARLVSDQLALQDIAFDVVRIDDDPDAACGSSGCGCTG